MTDPIPVHDIGTQNLSVLTSLEPQKLDAILAAGQRQLGRLPLAFFDHRSKAWARRTGNPYFDPIDELSENTAKGLWFMNFCYEWGCTTGAFTPENGSAPVMRRTLDWPFDEIGRNVVLVKSDTPTGPVKLATWPGFVGVISGLAPGRFAVMINQAPLHRKTGILPLDWFSARWAVRRSNALPPAHVLRIAFETCATFDDAVSYLTDTPIALPVIFTIAGCDPAELATIERGETWAKVDRGRALAANHWRLHDQSSRSRGADSQLRATQMAQSAKEGDAPFQWLRPPILNKDTRLALECDMSSGALRAIGYEKSGPATSVTTC